jgi:hypothetical protein
MKNFSKEEIGKAISETKSMRAAAKYLNVKYDTFKKYAECYDLFKTNQAGVGLRKGKIYKVSNDVFQNEKEIPSGVLKQWLSDEREWVCEECHISEWKGKKLPLEIDHMDGDRFNNLRENLRILCPNCHSLTPTWRGRGINSSNKHIKKISDIKLIDALKSEKSIRAALIKVGLAPKGGNYSRAYKLIEEIS